jgi:transposase
MRQVHRAGDKLFIDYCGNSVPIIDAGSGEIRSAQIFVAVLGASSYTYAEASFSQSLPDWIGSHIRTFEFLGAVPALLVPDNLKSAIKLACRYEPEATSTYADLARHYGTAILPARPYRPRDKAAVEAGVLLVQRWILARLRNRQFFSLAELNAAIGALLIDLNNRPFKKLEGSRASAFASIDRPAMAPLPVTRYEYAQWKAAIVNIDYHVEIDAHYYSVPHRLVRLKLEVRFTATTVECFFKGKRVAVHVRSYLPGRHTTLPEHMPESHRKHSEWSPRRLLNWGASIGPGSRDVVKWQLENRPHPEQGYRFRYLENVVDGDDADKNAVGIDHRQRLAVLIPEHLDGSRFRIGCLETNVPIVHQVCDAVIERCQQKLADAKVINELAGCVHHVDYAQRLAVLPMAADIIKNLLYCPILAHSNVVRRH